MRAKASSLLVAAFIGLGVGSSWRLISSVVDAAPKDILGSPNVAVDSYNNVKGSFVLMADGTIFAVKNGTTSGTPSVNYVAGVTNLGHNYGTPPTTAYITSPTSKPGYVKGSPNVAVKALVRSDATYVLFSDGEILVPANSDAAAPGSGQRILQGTLVPLGGTEPLVAAPGQTGFTSTSSSDDPLGLGTTTGIIHVQVTYSTPYSSTPTVMLGGVPGYTTTYVADSTQFTATLYPAVGVYGAGGTTKTGAGFSPVAIGSSGTYAVGTTPESALSFAVIGN